MSSSDADLPTLTAAAESFLASQPWCASVLRVTPIFVIEGVIGVFRCSLITAHMDAEPMVWVIVGDLPSAHIAHEPGDSWQDAVRGYVEEMERWVEAVRDGKPVDRLIPVDVPPTRDSADLLAPKLEFLRTNLVDVDPKSVRNDVSRAPRPS